MGFFALTETAATLVGSLSTAGVAFMAVLGGLIATNRTLRFQAAQTRTTLEQQTDMTKETLHHQAELAYQEREAERTAAKRERLWGERMRVYVELLTHTDDVVDWANRLLSGREVPGDLNPMVPKSLAARLQATATDAVLGSLAQLNAAIMSLLMAHRDPMPRDDEQERVMEEFHEVVVDHIGSVRMAIRKDLGADDPHVTYGSASNG